MTSFAFVADPSVQASGDQQISAVEGALSDSQVVATFTDPGGAEATGDYSATINWGDGTDATAADQITYDSDTGIFSDEPAVKITAAVSEMLRPMPRMSPVAIPGSADGSTTFSTVCHLEAPRVYETSR